MDKDGLLDLVLPPFIFYNNFTVAADRLALMYVSLLLYLAFICRA